MVGQSYIRAFSLKCGRNPAVTLLAALLLAAGSVWLTAHSLEFKTDRNDLVSRHQRYVQLATQYEEEFKGLDDLIVVVRAEDAALMRLFADELTTRLRAAPDKVEEVFYRIEPDTFEGKKLLFLPVPDLEDISDNLADHQDFIEELLDEPSLHHVLKFVNRKMKEALVDEVIGSGLIGGTDEDSSGSDGQQVQFLISILRQMNDALVGRKTQYVSPWSELFGGSIQHDGYITTKDDRYLIMQVRHVMGEGFLKHAGPIQFIRDTIRALQQKYPGVEAGVTGQPALGADEMTSAQDDMKVASLLSLGGVALLYFVAFRQFRRPMLVVLCLIIGICWSLGYLTLTVGHLSILTVAFTSILIGLGIDFGFHLLTRYEEERANGLVPNEALDVSLTQTLPGLFATAMTTALAFFAIMLADFQGIRELGWISGGGIILTFLSTIVCLPALLMLLDRNATAATSTTARPNGTLTRLVTGHPNRVFITSVLVTLLSIPALFLVTFDYNLLNLQGTRSESVRWEKRILESSQESSWFAMATADSRTNLESKVAKFSALGTVDRVQSLLDLMPPDEVQKARLNVIESISETLEDLDVDSDEQPGLPDVDKLKSILEKIKFTLRNKDDDKSALGKKVELARAHLLSLLDALSAAEPAEASNALAPFQQELLGDFRRNLKTLKNNSRPKPLTLEDVPDSIRSRTVSDKGRFLIRIYARENIWQRENMLAFVEQLRTVDEDVTGPPVVGSESITLMKDGYAQGGIYAFIAIVVVVFVTFRRVSDVLLCLAPVLIATVWTVGLMWAFGLQFNLANLVVIPLIIGIAVDGGIHMVHRAREDGSASGLISSSTSRAVALSFLSTMIGFGSLMCAEHYGIYSLGLLLTLAVGASLAVTLLVLPIILNHVFGNQ